MNCHLPSLFVGFDERLVISKPTLKCSIILVDPTYCMLQRLHVAQYINNIAYVAVDRFFNLVSFVGYGI